MKARPGWKTLPRLPLDIGRRSLLASGAAGRLFTLRFFERERDRALVGFVRFEPPCAGPPGHVHGGVTALVLDEAMGAATWLKGYRAVAGRLEFDYHEMVPIGPVIEVEARARATSGRRVRVTCSLRRGKKTFVKGTGVFVRLSDDVIEHLLGKERGK